MNNLRFEIDGNEIDMGDVRVSFQLRNPMFEEVGSYSLPFKIPRNRHNDNIITSNHAAAYGADKRFDAILYAGPIPLNGEYVISKVTELSYEGYFTTGNSTFRDLVRGVNLNDLDYTEEITGSAIVSFTDELTDAAGSSYPTYNYTCFPFLAPNYYNESPFAYNEMINPWSYHPNEPDLVGFYPTSSRDLTLLFAPSFYLCFVIQKVFDLYGYAIKDNDIYDDTELRTLVIANFNTLGLNDTTYQQYDLTFADALPPIEINDFISSIEKMFNVTFFISDISKSVIIKKNTDIVKSSASKPLKLVSRELEPEDEIDGFVLNYNMDPDDEFSAITDISNYNLGLTIDNTDDLSSYDAEDYKNALCKISNNDLYYLSKLSDASTDTWEWELLTKNYFEYDSGGKELEIITDANPILTDRDYIYCYYGTDVYEFAIFPKVSLSCINSNGLQEYKTFQTLRLLFYRGIVDGGGSWINPSNVQSEYPLATPDVYRAKATATPTTYGREKISSANQSLRWDGTYGLYETNWKDYLYWYINLRRPAKDTYEMSLQEILSINFWEKYRAGDAALLFRTIELELDFSSDSITPGECSVYLS